MADKVPLCHYVEREMFRRMDTEYEQIIGMLASMELKADRFWY